DDKTDSYVLVTISGDATFTGVLNGRYVDAITGDVKNVTDGKLTAKCSGKGNLRVYVLDTDKTKAPGKVGTDGKYLYASSPVTGNWVEWPNETMPDETWTSRPNIDGGGGGGDRQEPETVIEPTMNEGEQAIFFEHDSWNPATAWIWSNSANYTGGKWPGQNFTYLGNNIYKWTYTGSGKIPAGSKVIISHNGNDQLSKDGWDFVNGGYYTANGYEKTISGAGEIPDDPIVPSETDTYTVYFDNSESNWGQVNAWVWDANNGNKNYTGGTWPGKKIELDPESGYHKFSCTVKDANPKMMVIFNNGSAQTADLDLMNNGIYTASGFTGNYHSATGFADQVSMNEVKVSTFNSSLTVESTKALILQIVRVDGMVILANIQPGINTIDLPKGLYIVAGKKIIL
ncbi:MAG: starch-binding protein, partial [Muribaculaceae bacterium]|nr:starch-binding protein [Muribaculaceae bacterium]